MILLECFISSSTMYFSTIFPSFILSLSKTRSYLGSRTTIYGGFLITRRMVSSFPFSSFFQGGNFDRTKAKGSRARQPLFQPLPQLFYPLVFAVLHFPQMRAYSLDIGWHLRCLESKDYDCFWAHLRSGAARRRFPFN